MENRKQTANFAEKQYTMADTDEYSKGEIVLYQPDETVKLEVRLDNETVWLTQQQMAELFDKDRTVIGRHIRNIYSEQELEQNITSAKFAYKGSDGDLYKECGKSKRHIGNISCYKWL